jgi:hypothetical protein
VKRLLRWADRATIRAASAILAAIDHLTRPLAKGKERRRKDRES